MKYSGDMRDSPSPPMNEARPRSMGNSEVGKGGGMARRTIRPDHTYRIDKKPGSP